MRHGRDVVEAFYPVTDPPERDRRDNRADGDYRQGQGCQGFPKVRPRSYPGAGSARRVVESIHSDLAHESAIRSKRLDLR